jgi:2-polyprenyl-3-methyl-5-hydroxy-6-metoxy-1,4-benzoquinol methylase
MNNQSPYSCEICSSTDFIVSESFTRRLTEEGSPQFKVVKCKQCGLCSLYPIPSNADLQWIYSNYSLQGNRLAVERLRIDKIYPEKIRKIENFHSSPKILDIGAGLGGFCYVCKAQGLEVYGIEMEAEQVKIAKKIFDVDLRNLSIDVFLAGNEKKFDVVHLHHVLEHLQHPKDVLIKIKKILSASGIVIFEVPNQFFVFGNEIKLKLKIKTPKKPYNPYHHIYFFSPHTLRLLIKASGYKILELNQIAGNQKSLKTRTHETIADFTRMGYSNRIEAIIRTK